MAAARARSTHLEGRLVRVPWVVWRGRAPIVAEAKHTRLRAYVHLLHVVGTLAQRGDGGVGLGVRHVDRIRFVPQVQTVLAVPLLKLASVAEDPARAGDVRRGGGGGGGGGARGDIGAELEDDGRVHRACARERRHE